MKETRHIEIRAQQDENEEMIITGTPIVFDTPTKINDPKGAYNEVISRSALNGVDLNDTRLLINHNANSIPLARTPKTMTLSVDDEGVHMRAILPNTEEGKGAFQAVKRQDMDGMSFSFTCDSDGSHYDAETRTRTISKFRKIYECSLVNYPAYQTTSLEARSQIDEAEKMKQEREEALITVNKILFGGHQ